LLLIGLLGSTLDARPLIDIQQDLKVLFQDAYKAFNIYTNNARCTLKQIPVATCTKQHLDPNALHIVFYSLENLNEIRTNLPGNGNDNFQVIPKEHEWINKIYINAINGAITPLEKQFYSSLQQAINRYVDKDHCLVLSISHSEKFTSSITVSEEFGNYLKEHGGLQYIDDILENMGDFNIYKAQHTMNMISLMTFLEGQLKKLPPVSNAK